MMEKQEILIEEMRKAENQNEYKYRLLFEYRDTVEKG